MTWAHAHDTTYVKKALIYSMIIIMKKIYVEKEIPQYFNSSYSSLSVLFAFSL